MMDGPREEIYIFFNIKCQHWLVAQLYLVKKSINEIPKGSRPQKLKNNSNFKLLVIIFLWKKLVS